MDNEIKISVIMPVYNSEQYVSAAIESVLTQSYKNFELIIIDDGSSDGSGEICRSLEKKDDRIKYYHKENGGLCSARNMGIDKSSGDYLFFMDNDDEIKPELFSDCVNYLNQCPTDIIKFEKTRRVIVNNALEKDVASTGIKSINEGKKIKYFNRNELIEKFYDIYSKNLFMYIWTGIFSRKLITDNGLRFNELFKNGHEDILMNMQCIYYAESIAFVDEVYYIHNWRSGTSASSIFTMDRIRDAMIVADYEKHLLKSFGYGSEYVLATYMDNLFICLHMMNGSINRCSIKKQIKILKRLNSRFHSILGNYNEDIKKLVSKKKYKHALLAFLFYAKRYITLIAVYKLYANYVNISDKLKK